MIARILAWALRLMPLSPIAHRQAVAEAIASTDATTGEAAVLTVISFSETGFGRAGVPFGACSFMCRSHCGQCRTGVPLPEVARHALNVVRRGLRACSWLPESARVPCALRYFHSGVTSGWREDPFSMGEVCLVEQLLSGAPLGRCHQGHVP